MNTKVEAFNSLVRSILTLLLVTVFCFLALREAIDSGLFANTVMVALTWWFASRDTKKEPPVAPPPPPANGGPLP